MKRAAVYLAIIAMVVVLLVLLTREKREPAGGRETTEKSAVEVKPPAPKTSTRSGAGARAEPPPPAAAGEVAPRSGSAGLRGVARFEGVPPAPRKIDMSRDPACVRANPGATQGDIEVGRDGGLRNVFVYVKSGLPLGERRAPRADRAVLDQKGCLYAPSVLGVEVGQPLEIVNSDPLLHNVHAFARPGEFNQAMPRQGQRLERKFQKPQVMVPVKCEVHPWMQAWIGVVDHPYFSVTDEDGRFAIEGVPDGSYALELWHPTLGTRTAEVALKDGAAEGVQVVFRSE